jgi:hypothetical protein
MHTSKTFSRSDFLGNLLENTELVSKFTKARYLFEIGSDIENPHASDSVTIDSALFWTPLRRLTECIAVSCSHN